MVVLCQWSNLKGYGLMSKYITTAQQQERAKPWWRHQMETFSALLAICAGNSPVPGEFPTQRPVTRSFDVYFDLSPNKVLSKYSWGWWFETLSGPLWRQSNARVNSLNCIIYQRMLCLLNIRAKRIWWNQYIILLLKDDMHSICLSILYSKI